MRATIWHNPGCGTSRKTLAILQETPGVDMSSGSLGQGISAAVGMALAGKMDKKDYRVYTLLGDGEIQEGQIWISDKDRVIELGPVTLKAPSLQR